MIDDETVYRHVPSRAELRALVNSWGWGWCSRCHERPCRRRRVVTVDVPFMVFQSAGGVHVRNVASDWPWP